MGVFQFLQKSIDYRYNYISLEIKIQIKIYIIICIFICIFYKLCVNIISVKVKTYLKTQNPIMCLLEVMI